MYTLGVVGFLFEEVYDDDDHNEKADVEMDSVWQEVDDEAHSAFSIYDLVDPEDSTSSYYHYWHFSEHDQSTKEHSVYYNSGLKRYNVICLYSVSLCIFVF